MDAFESARKLTERLSDRENVTHRTASRRATDSVRDSNPQASENHNDASSFEGIRHFFDYNGFDVYSKETLGPESYSQPGNPCHGGYADASEAPESDDAPVHKRKQDKP